MTTFKVKHKYCNCISIIKGYDFYDACRKSNKDPKFWELIEE